MDKYFCGFGHRQIFQNIDSELNKAVKTAIRCGCNVFLAGGMGEFDAELSSIVRIAKRSNPNIKIILVLPYLTKQLISHKNYYYSMYDDIIIPDELAGIHYKSAITKRNQWMTDRCEIIISYTVRNYGGAFRALEYARKNHKTIIEIAPTSEAKQ